ncbi:nifU-like protein 1, chloroplastic [Lolium perenne]|uniref:nifU-like protein 1, chloroplastic n=1 Tax=Lolium perenne TaxID=4522 RepID=UPI0021EA1A3D|nr:nifU-like protein 1, chloroplastic [Lolium perenne]XP_051181472.1 nifU-like protein 1, chloroplastic [Lolium perenne]XP_051181473.1 nifU-like protein 1, chloroplastic [Lolium perenne]
MEASLTAAAAAASSPPPQIRIQIVKPSPLLAPWRRQFGPSKIRTANFRRHLAAASASTPPTPGGGLYSAATYELTADNVDQVLDDVRPYLVADGGDVAVVSVEDGVVSLRLEGACSSCPSSTTTMNMGIERVLKEKFGDAIKDIRQVFDGDQPPAETTPEAVNRHLDILRPAIANYGGSVEVLAVDGEDCMVKYDGPESIGSGVKAAIKEKFPDITNVVFTQ